jgi:high-affinity nickel-transport protein
MRILPARRSRHDNPRNTQIPLIIAGLVCATAGVFIWAALTFRAQPALLSSAVLAYVLGLRHAVDPDHIAAIDNVTRKLMRDGQRPATTGLWFALGHSSIVMIGAMAVALTASSLTGGAFSRWREIGGLFSTTLSATFLIVIAVCNLQVMADLWRAARRMRRTGQQQTPDADPITAAPGLLSRLFRPLFALVSKPRHLYPLGFLFGLGFDTATEIGLFGLSGAEAAHGAPLWVIAIFPMLFAVGMTLIDTLDGILMLGAYGWAYVNPVRKLVYNLVMTTLSVVVALVVGGLEVLGLFAGSVETGFWTWVGFANEHFGTLGFIIIGLFAAVWLTSWLIYRLGRLAPAASPANGI